MVSVNYQNNVNFYQTSGIQKKQSAHLPVSNPQGQTENTTNFKAEGYQPVIGIRTELTSKDEKKKYNDLVVVLDKNYRKKLDFALKTGILLKNDSADKSSVLENLHKILKEPRDQGLDGQTIVKEALDIIYNPYVITQTCEDIPVEYKTPIIGLITDLTEDVEEIKRVNFELDNMHTGTCPTASVEFDLATKQPAEFFRMVEGLTSPKNETYKIIDMKSLSDKTLHATWLLEKFKTPHKKLDFDKAIIQLKPDKNAIIRARIQNNHRDPGERSIIDILMQSTMMQLGSQQTYDSLTDTRAPNEWTNDNGYDRECASFEILEKKLVDSYKQYSNTKNIASVNNIKNNLSSICNTILSYSNYDSPCVITCLDLDNIIKTYDEKYLDKIDIDTRCGISGRLIQFIGKVVKWMKYIVPVIVIVLSMLDFIKATGADKEDEIKKAQNKFIRRLIIAALIFIVPFIIEFVLNKMGFDASGCGIIDL